MNQKLVFVDTETTGLDPDRHEVWEVAIITADPYEDGSGYQFEEWTQQLPINLALADPMALSISGFYERSEQWRDSPTGKGAAMFDWAKFTREVVERTRGRYFIGAVPSFDAIRLEKIIRAKGMIPTWHYHLVDVEHLAAGYLAFAGRQSPLTDPEQKQLELARPPWKSDDLAAAVGVTIAPEDRHTAMGDARWARDIYFAVMGGR